MSIMINNISFPRDEIKNRLENIGRLNGKNVSWVRADLTLENSSWIGRLFWTFVAKYFQGLRELFYHIDLEKSKNFLNQLEPQVVSDPELKGVYDQAVNRFNELFPKHKAAFLPTVASLVNGYNAAWDGKVFQDVKVDPLRLKKVLKISTEVAVKQKVKDSYGFILKKNLEPGSKIFVRADLHGDLKSLLENIYEIQKAGLLDENFKCKEKVQLVFLGDYMDRGAYDTQVLELLATLRIENINQVTLLKGNHEDLMINQIYAGSEDFRKFIAFESEDFPEHSQILNDFYESLPLSVYMGERNEKGKRHNVHFTHGLFELRTDPSLLLECVEANAGLNVPKEQDFSDRIIMIEEAPSVAATKAERRAWKLWQAADRIFTLAEKEYPMRFVSTYNWGDVGENDCTEGDPGARRWTLSPESVKHYMRLSEGPNTKVKMVIRGHQHQHEHFRHHKVKEKVIMTTLTIGMDSHPHYTQHYPGQSDRAYILFTAPKVKEWQKQGLLREPGSSNSQLTERVSIHSDEV